MVMRGQFDMTLAGRAQEAGADLMTECPVVGVDQARTKTTLRCGRRTVHADFVVAADGATGPVVRTLGWARRHRAAPALEAEVTVSPALLDQLADTARFDIGYLPFGYAWIFPKLRHLSIGLLCTRPPSRPLSEYLAAYLKARGIDAPRSVTRHGYVIPLVPVDPPYVRGRSLVVGDAAGFADPVTAEGISFAVLTGQLAARAIIDGAMNGGSVRRSYHAALRRRVISELRVARLYAKVLYGSMGGRENILRQYGAGVAQVLVDVFSGATTYREALATPNLLRQLRAVWTGVAA
jgi:flavin-dependent dehydrogenase